MSEELAIYGGKKTIKVESPTWPQYGENEKDYLIKALDQSIGCASDARAVGYTIRFEKDFARYHNRKYGVACFNCTQGLEAALSILDIGPGDEVLVPPYTFMATISSVIRVGGIPVFVDINPETMCMDLDLLDKAVSPNTRAVIPVHLGGYMEDMKRLRGWADPYDILVLEDAAQAQGACREGQYPAAFTMGAVFSFQRNKNMVAGEGGIFLTDYKDLANRFREFIWHGTKQNGPAGHHSISSNLRITEFQSAILLGQLEKLTDQNQIRMEVCDRLEKIINEIEGFKALKPCKIDVHPRYLFIFRIDRTYWKDIPKDWIIECLRAEGLRCGGGNPYPVYRNPVFVNNNYPAIYKMANQEAFEAGKLDYRNLYLQNTEKACEEVIIIPHFVFLSDPNISKAIGEALNKISKNKSVLYRKVD